mmetsp:Transcript_32955/g.87096  ORF Transcript_32955/g.87096 Transcript_32955/m.87096 type:complete len:222 (-) Transcript_32955:45-710(-)
MKAATLASELCMICSSTRHANDDRAAWHTTPRSLKTRATESSARSRARSTTSEPARSKMSSCTESWTSSLARLPATPPVLRASDNSLQPWLDTTARCSSQPTERVGCWLAARPATAALADNDHGFERVSTAASEQLSSVSVDASATSDSQAVVGVQRPSAAPNPSHFVVSPAPSATMPATCSRKEPMSMVLALVSVACRRDEASASTIQTKVFLTITVQAI